MIWPAAASGTTASRPYPISKRSFRSSAKTTRSTPLSSPFWPSRHCWKSRLVTSSRLSPSSERKIAIAIWVPVARSYRASFASSRARSGAASSPAQSFTRAPGAGGSARATARSAGSSRLELHLGRGRRVPRGLEEGLGLVASEGRDDGAGEQAQARVVVAHRLVEASPLHGDAVLRALELGLEREEVRVRLEIGVALDGHQETTQGARELVLSGLEPLERLGIAEGLGRELDGAGARARPRHLLQDRPLLSREALHGLDEVRDEVGAALVDVLHLRPLLVDVLLGHDELVVDGHRPGEDADDDDDDHREGDQEATHHNGH